MSYKVNLTTEESYILADKMKETQNKKLSRRLLAISLRHFGYKVKDISLIVGVSEKTITSWIKMFLEGGFDQLLGLNYPKERQSMLAPYKEKIRTYRQEKPESKLEDLQKWLEEEHQIKVDYSWLYRYIELHKL
ncbi:MAG: helix-turn-helix domain-containing protein [Bacteroidia bacterium]|nr:helix-turn-helix domain-containing protein [Bacteroidia bacterium]